MLIFHKAIPEDLDINYNKMLNFQMNKAVQMTKIMIIG